MGANAGKGVATAAVGAVKDLFASSGVSGKMTREMGMGGLGEVFGSAKQSNNALDKQDEIASKLNTFAAKLPQGSFKKMSLFE